MYINEQYSKMELLEEKKYICIKRDGERVEEENFVLREHLLEIYVNEVLTMKVVCTPEYLTELVLGRLFTEGVIENVDEIEGIFICEFGSRAKVSLFEKEYERDFEKKYERKYEKECEKGKFGCDYREKVEKNYVENGDDIERGNYIETVSTCCTGNRFLNDWFVKKGDNASIKKIERMDWKEEWIFAMADRMAEGMPLHSETWGTHSCFLSKDGEIIFECEDIGRHNALDKVIGYALRHGIKLEQCMVYSSGRIPVDMAEKVIKAGIPVLASKAVPTKEAIELAEEYGLTLICSARRDRMRVYTDFGFNE